MANILEQEDDLKGMPDSMLLIEMEQPSGRYPPFLIASEQQRRNSMRENYAASEQQPTTTIAEQEFQKGLASAMPTSSPVPVTPNSSSPPFPVGDVQQGLAGAGVQMMANTGGQFPDLSGDGKVTRKDILMGRGVVPMQEAGQFPSPFAVSTSYDPFALYKYLGSKGIDATKYTVSQLKQMMESEDEGYTPERMGYGLLSYDPNHPSNKLIDALKSAPASLFSESGAERVAGDIEAQERAVLGQQAETAGQDVAESITDYIQSDPMPMQIAKGSYGLMEDYLSPHITGIKDAAMNLTSLPGQLYDKGYELYSGAGDAIGNATDSFDNAVYDLLGMTDEPSDAQARRVAILDGDDPLRLNNLIDTSGFTDAAGGIVDKISQFFNTSDETTDDEPTEKVQEQGSVIADRKRTTFNTDLDPNIPPPNIPSPVETDENLLDLMLGDYEDLESASETESENLRSLIEQNRASAKSRAFNLGIAALGAGIAGGNMSKGMENAVAIASDTLAKGEAAAAPLEAAAATRGTQALRDRIEALGNMARADANYKQVQAMITREGGLTQRSQYDLLRVLLPLAQDSLLEQGIYPGDETYDTEFNRLVEGFLSRAGLTGMGTSNPSSARKVYNEETGILDAAVN